MGLSEQMQRALVSMPAEGEAWIMGTAAQKELMREAALISGQPRGPAEVPLATFLGLPIVQMRGARQGRVELVARGYEDEPMITAIRRG